MNPGEHAHPVEDNRTSQGAGWARRAVSRRTLVRAGWTVPVILALHLPANAFAQYPCVDDPSTEIDECQPL